ncbi:MAG: hypothetical protein R3B68_12290 [Phycisphaerales bacterium]
MIRPINPGPALVLIAGAACLTGCIKAQNDRFDVAGRMPAALEAGPTTPGRAGDAPSVVSLDRANWSPTAYEIDNHGVHHNATYARRNTRFGVSARASGAYPTVAEALSLPGGPSESEQIYDAVTWPIVIAPATVAVPLGFIVEPQGMDIQRSPQWEYDRRPGAASAIGPRQATGDPFVYRLGLPALDGASGVASPAGSGSSAPVQAPVVEPSARPQGAGGASGPMYPIEPAPGGAPIGEPDPAEMPVPTGEPGLVPTGEPGAAPGGGQR